MSSTTSNKSNVSGVAVGGFGGITGVVIGFINIQYSDSEFLPVITTLVPIALGGIFWAIEYARSYFGVRSKEEIEVDAQFTRAISHLDSCIADTFSLIESGKKAGLDTSKDEAFLADYKKQKHEVRLAYSKRSSVKFTTAE